MPTFATDWQSAAELTGAFIVFLALVYLWLRRMIEGAPTEPQRDTIPDFDPEYAVRFDVDPLSPEPFVDAQETLLPLEDAEQIKCTWCRLPLSSLTAEHCWHCGQNAGGGKDAA